MYYSIFSIHTCVRQEPSVLYMHSKQEAQECICVTVLVGFTGCTLKEEKSSEEHTERKRLEWWQGELDCRDMVHRVYIVNIRVHVLIYLPQYFSPSSIVIVSIVQIGDKFSTSWLLL